MNRAWSDAAARAGEQLVPKDRASLVFANSLSWFLFKLNLAPSLPILVVFQCVARQPYLSFLLHSP